ncbi:unnamed protein product, partial [Linum tenue]
SWLDTGAACKPAPVWDCGLACCNGSEYRWCQDCSIEALADISSTTSIWTVDLAYLLKRFSVRFSYFTVTIGANPSYSVETYYKEQLPTDVLRVDMLFEKASEEGINILCRSIMKKKFLFNLIWEIYRHCVS